MFWKLFKRKKGMRSEKNVREEVSIPVREPVDLIRFFRNERPDNRGRYHKDLLQYDADFIERKHDFIQWIFPTMKKSGFNPDAPIIDEDFRERFQKDE